MTEKTEQTEQIEERIIDIEEQILYFILKDKKYIDRIFFIQHIPIEYFQSKDVRKLVEIVYDYYINFKSLLVEDEMNKVVDALYSRKEINNIEQTNLKILFEEVSSPLFRGGTISDEQFNRIFETWLNLESTTPLISILQEGLKIIHTGNGIAAIDKMSKKFREIHRADISMSPIVHLSAFKDIDVQMKDLTDRLKKKDDEKGIKTGIKSIDRYFSGFEPGTLTAIGAPVGNCKSTLMLNFSRNQAMAGKKVLVISMEMPAIQWVRKLNSSSTHIEYTDILTGNRNKITDGTVSNFKEFLEKRSNGEGGYEVVFIPAEVYTWEDIVDEINKQHPHYNADIWYLDQLSLINLSKYGGHQQRRDIALGDLAKDIRSTAQLRHIAICMAVQINRAAIKFDPKGERKVDINIENLEDSNKVAAHLDNFFGIHKMDDDKKLSFKIVKQREGESDKTILLHCRLEVCHIGDEDDMVKIVYSDVDEVLMEYVKDEGEESKEEKTQSMPDSIEELLGNDEIKHKDQEKEEVKIEGLEPDIVEVYSSKNIESYEDMQEAAHRGAVKEGVSKIKMSDLINNSFSKEQKKEYDKIISEDYENTDL